MNCKLKYKSKNKLKHKLKKILSCAVAAACVIWAFALLSIPLSAHGCAGEIYLEVRRDVSGILVLDVIFEPSEAGICGLELDIIYSSEVLMLSSCERGEGLEELRFDCSLGDGRVRLLLWGTDNSSAGGRVATVGFIPLCGEDEDIEFSLCLPTKTSAIYLCGDGIYVAELSLRGLSVTLEGLGGKGETESDIESGTECMSERVTEVITEDVIEYITESVSESDLDYSTEHSSEHCSENCSESSSKANSGDIGGSGKDIGRRYQNLCFGMLAIPSLLSVGVVLPLGLCKDFRRRYF